MPNLKTKIELDEAEAKMFLHLFRKYYYVWEKAKALRPGSLTLHFDKDWNIKKHELHFYSQTKP